MVNSERNSATLKCARWNRKNTSRQSLPGCKLWRRIRTALQNPLTFVLLVWAAMFATTVVFLAFLD